jgi:uncharacterized protein YbjT (DUF2867 family)
LTPARDVLLTGGTGYIGRRLVLALLRHGHRVRVLARAGSMARVPSGAASVEGNVLKPDSVLAALRPGDTVVHLVGTPHPNPSKAEEFIRVDLASVHAAAPASRRVGVSHFVYVSVAHPAPVMRAYIAVREAGEKIISELGLTATVLRPWYVLGPGHWWPVVLVPMYAVAELIPSWRDAARRLGLVTLPQMVRALVRAVEDPPPAGTIRVVDVPAIRAS